MYKCEYCGRLFKNVYEECPGCGSTKLNRNDFVGEKIIEEPPEGGYILNKKNYEKNLKYGVMIKWISIIGIVIIIISDIPFIVSGLLAMSVDREFGIMFILLPISVTIIFSAIFGISVIGGYIKEKESKEYLKKLDILSKNGVLIKNISYKLVPSGTVINGVPINCIKVEYKDKSGNINTYISEEKYEDVNENISRNDQTVDLLIDPNDNTNYYIDFEIY